MAFTVLCLPHDNMHVLYSIYFSLNMVNVGSGVFIQCVSYGVFVIVQFLVSSF